jgi:hypothetical protein
MAHLQSSFNHSHAPTKIANTPPKASLNQSFRKKNIFLFCSAANHSAAKLVQRLTYT